MEQADEAADIVGLEIDDFGDFEGEFDDGDAMAIDIAAEVADGAVDIGGEFGVEVGGLGEVDFGLDRKSTRLNSSHRT